MSIVNKGRSTPCSSTVIGEEHEQVNLAGGECRCCTTRPDHTAEPSDRATGVGQLQREGIGAAGWYVADGKGAVGVDRLGKQVA